MGAGAANQDDYDVHMKPAPDAGERKSRQVPPGDTDSTANPLLTCLSQQCDSKHPRCTACATANTQCTQEDRIRQTLTPRGHTDHLEHLLTQCNALLKSYDPGFDLANIEDILARRGIDPNNTVSSPSVSFEQARSPTFRAETASPSGRHKIFSYPPIVHPGFPLPLPYGHPPPPPGAVPYPIPHGFPPHLHAPFQPIPPSAPPPSNPADTTSVTPSNPFPAVLGQDPRFNDMSSDEVSET